MAEKNQGTRIVKILEMLKNETDENHVLTGLEINERLQAQGLSVERRTLYKDIQLLRDAGFDVETSPVGHAYGYYLVDQPFSVAELKLIVDALHAANFLTEKKTDELVEKIANIGGKYKAEDIKNNNVHFNSHKHSNEEILFAVEQLNKAIKEQKRITCRVVDINEKGKFVNRHGKKIYMLEPLALIHNGDNYYVLCYDNERDVYPRRIDRLRHINIADEDLSDTAKEKIHEADRFTDGVFRMYGGKREKVTLRFKDSALNSIYDHFGEKTKVEKTDSANVFQTEVEVEISPTFWGWLFQFAGEMKIISPKWAVDEYKGKLKSGNAIED